MRTRGESQLGTRRITKIAEPIFAFSFCALQPELLLQVSSKGWHDCARPSAAIPGQRNQLPSYPWNVFHRWRRWWCELLGQGFQDEIEKCVRSWLHVTMGLHSGSNRPNPLTPFIFLLHSFTSPSSSPTAFESKGNPISCTAFNRTGAIFAYAVSYDWHKGWQAAPAPNTPQQIFLHPCKEEDVKRRAKK